MELKYQEIKNRKCFYCGCPESVRAIHEHHVFKRGTNPELINEPANKCDLCWKCHRRTEEDHAFLVLIQNLWTIQTKHQDN